MCLTMKTIYFIGVAGRKVVTVAVKQTIYFLSGEFYRLTLRRHTADDVFFLELKGNEA